MTLALLPPNANELDIERHISPLRIFSQQLQDFIIMLCKFLRCLRIKLFYLGISHNLLFSIGMQRYKNKMAILSIKTISNKIWAGSEEYFKFAIHTNTPNYNAICT